jgi:hypothetical protein
MIGSDNGHKMCNMISDPHNNRLSGRTLYKIKIMD